MIGLWGVVMSKCRFQSPRECYIHQPRLGDDSEFDCPPCQDRLLWFFQFGGCVWPALQEDLMDTPTEKGGTPVMGNIVWVFIVL